MPAIAPIHSSELNSLSFLNIDLSSGLAEDTYFEATPNSPLTTSGSDAGSKERYISANSDKSGTIVITLYTQSPSNLKLAGLVAASRLDGNKPVIGDMYIEANGSLYLYQPLGCHVQERPTSSIGKDMATATQTWTFDCADLNEININDYNVSADLKASISGEIKGSVTSSVTI